MFSTVLKLSKQPSILANTSKLSKYTYNATLLNGYATNNVEPKRIDKVLIANRGEIACRVIESARKIGIRTVAVYSEADANSRHVEMADEAYLIGPPAAAKSYLKGDRILEVAKRSNAQAIHPGYGFLSENASFVKQCESNGVEFIGPPTPAITAMASKRASKEIMIKANVPVVPGYHGSDQSLSTLKSEAAKIGFPLLIKAELGGGGKGMKIINSMNEFDKGIESAKREAIAFFNDDKVIMERYLTRPRHIEVQVFADKHGNVVHCYERDCSLQRRHQKIIEEAPAPGISEEVRERITTAAKNAAKAVGYVGAGTVEFIVDCETNEFFFMEMNTRLQVEHPISEMITDIDLVEWQLRVARGEKLPKAQEEIKRNGHSFEARIYAEDPDNDFLPGSGKLIHLSPPKVMNEGITKVRVDTGVRQNDEVSVYYDPMIAKLIVWDEDRQKALDSLHNALQQYEVAGLTTNIPFLKKVTRHHAFEAGDVETNFIQKYAAELQTKKETSEEVVALAALYMLLRSNDALHSSISCADATSPWATLANKRFNHENTQTITLLDGDNEINAQIKFIENSVDEFIVTVNDKELFVSGEICSTTDHSSIVSATIGDFSSKFTIVDTEELDQELNIFFNGELSTVSIPKPAYAGGATVKGSLFPPVPGTIIKVLVSEGDAVKQNDPLIILEAMKMEHTIRATADGIVKSINFKESDLVNEKSTLAVIADE